MSVPNWAGWRNGGCVQGIAKGTLLANRYELTSELSDTPDLARWIARDEKLGREVALTIFPKKSSHAEAALDSARRVAGLEDARIVRVLDAGNDDTHAWIIEEAHRGAHTLADLARFEQLHPEEARRIVGETSAALEAARLRGLHHLQLTPANVLRLSDGSIVLTQLAVGAALSGQDDVSSSEANRIDAKGVVSLLYFALTRRWPGEDLGIAGVKAAQKIDGRYPSAQDFTEGVPSDLASLCDSTLNSDDGARTPGEVAKLVAPWAAQMITAPGRARGDRSANQRPEPQFTVRKASEDAPRKPGVGAVGAAALSAAAANKAADDDAPASGGSAKATGFDAGTLAASFGSFDAKNVAPVEDPADATMIGRRVEFDADETTTFTLDDEDRAYSRTSYDPTFEELEPPIPGLSSGMDDPDASSRKLALGIVALFVLGALFLAVLGLRNIGSGPAPTANNTPAASASTSAAPKASGKPSPSPSPSASGAKVDLTSASVISSSGYRVADTSSGPKSIDGDANTEWESLNYLNRPWGGYQGRGGIAIQMAQSTAVKTIKIVPGTYPLTADIYVGDVPGTSGDKIGSVSNATDTQTVDAKGAKGRYITIFITDMTQTSDSYFKASLAEVTVEK